MSRAMPTCSTLTLQTCLLLAITGCGTSRTTSYYVLESDSASRSSADQRSTHGSIIVGVAPVRVPTYLDRNQLVTRTSTRRVNVSDFESWAEPLESSVTRAIAVALDHDPNIKGTVMLPTIAEVKLDRVVFVEMVRFDGMLGGSVRLTARILILDSDRKPMVAPVRFNRTDATTDSSYDALVTSMGRLLDQLSQEVTRFLRTVE